MLFFIFLNVNFLLKPEILVCLWLDSFYWVPVKPLAILKVMKVIYMNTRWLILTVTANSFHMFAARCIMQTPSRY